MDSGKCTKKFPKDFQEETNPNCDGYPKYRRPNNGRFAMINGRRVDNRWIVPYNSFLSLKYNCHINVEVCASIKSVKYLFKYVYKGHDCANVTVQERGTYEHNEIKTYIDSRYVSAPEAALHLFGYRMHDQSHSIQRLQVHLQDHQSISFDPEKIHEAISKAATKLTTLTAWF